MTVTSTSLARVIGATALLLCACQDRASTGTEGGESSSTAAMPGSSTSSTLPDSTSSSTTEQAEGSSSTSQLIGESESEDGGAECDIYAQDCNNGEKCTPYSDQPDLIPDDIRCCPIIGDAPGQPGDTCEVVDYFGSCLDDCDVGSFCLDIDNDGEGTCQAFCGGTPNNPQCESDETCFVYFQGTPLCFDKCDPLVQDCGEGQGCYPDENAAGGTGFICLPQVGTENTYGDYCWLLSNCAPGFVCVTPDFQPDCDGVVGCCTPVCDTTEADTCDTFNSELECSSWYLNGQTPPDASLENVGVCILPP